MKFFIRYFLFPLSLILAGLIYHLIITNQWLLSHYGLHWADFIGFFVSFSFMAAWVIVWEWRFREESFPMNRNQWISDGLFSIVNGLAVAFGHMLVLSIPGEDALLGAWIPLHKFPFLVQATIFVLFQDFFLYWIHRTQHEHGSKFLWGLHRAHHIPPRYNMMVGPRNHIADSGALILTFCMVRTLGFSEEAVLWGMWWPGIVAALHHANLDMRLGWINYLVPGPEVHRTHHSYEINEAKNYASVTPVWDWVFGTLVPFHGPNELRYGAPEGDDTKETIWETHLWPLKALFSKTTSS
ncbi:MAG: sterol desaturase family protein [Bacteroidia bacterium]|nr:sterol desaturase family protein [Bacteroidia bacterium]